MMLWVAQGFGVGRIPVAPGTFGSVVGLLWFGLLLASGSFGVLVSGTLAGIALSIWLCDFAEKTLRKKDPGSVVLDEITAVPLCFFAWVALLTWKAGMVPPAGYFFSQKAWLGTLGIFVAFRFFDVVKPWPVRQSQSLPGGLGITIDDALAAVYVNLVTLAVFGAKALLVRG